jgi:hypothetical protein
LGGLSGIAVVPSLNIIGAKGSKPLSMGSPAQAIKLRLIIALQK